MGTGQLIIGLGIWILGYGIYSDIKNKKKKKLLGGANSNVPFDKVINPAHLPFIREIERMHSDNESMPLFRVSEIFERSTGLPSNGLKNPDILLGIENWEDLEERNPQYIVGDYITDLLSDLNRRFVVEYLSFDLKNEDEVLKEHGINIKGNENLIYKISNKVDLFIEKERTKSINYSGFSTSFTAGSLRYKMGSIQPFPKRESYWSHFDRGTLFFLDKRIVFVGSNKKINKIIKYDDIINGELFSNGVQLSLANSKKILIDFPAYSNTLNKRDDINIFTRVLQRILEKSYSINLN